MAQPVTIFSKTFHHRCLAGLLKRPLPIESYYINPYLAAVFAKNLEEEKIWIYPVAIDSMRTI